jgi:hypothetical protein
VRNRVLVSTGQAKFPERELAKDAKAGRGLMFLTQSPGQLIPFQLFGVLSKILALFFASFACLARELQRFG